MCRSVMVRRRRFRKILVWSQSVVHVFQKTKSVLSYFKKSYSKKKKTLFLESRPHRLNDKGGSRNENAKNATERLRT